MSPGDRKQAYGQFRNLVAQQGWYFFEVAEPTDRKRNTKWTAAITGEADIMIESDFRADMPATVLGVTYRSDAFTQGKMEALHLAAASALRHLLPF